MTKRKRNKKKYVLHPVMTFILLIIVVILISGFLSIFNISGCVGDIVTFMYIIKLDKDICFSEMDDMLSFSIYSSNDVSKVSHYGLKYIKSVSSIERKDLKKRLKSLWHKRKR